MTEDLETKRQSGANVRITTWQEWPAILHRLDELVASGMDGRDARLLATKEFGVSHAVLIDAVARGDVPCIPSPNKARVQANLRGDKFYQGVACGDCGGRERWVSDDQSPPCARARERERAARRKSRKSA